MKCILTLSYFFILSHFVPAQNAVIDSLLLIEKKAILIPHGLPHLPN
ncbi:MAG TPA: hypothetical protein PKO16_04235 [Bacteroidia bacterium]|nr:hypothetical protein [Bacteroidia bacterium]